MKTVHLPDGSTADFPDGMDNAAIESVLAQHFTAPESTLHKVARYAVQPGAAAGALLDQIAPGESAGERAINAGSGVLRGLGSVGATVMRVLPNALGGDTAMENEKRRTDMDRFAREIVGANPDSNLYKGAKLGAEIGFTAPLGGVIGKGVSMVVPALGEAIGSGGFSLGNAATGSKLANALLRIGGGAGNGAITAGAANPEDVLAGAELGGALPIGVKISGYAGDKIRSGTEALAEKLMNSALKPTIKMHQTGDAKLAVQTLLDRGISPTSKGVDKLGSMIEGVDDQISGLVSTSDKTVSKQKVIDYLRDVRDRFGNQVNPVTDLQAIDSAGEQFATHPSLPSDDISVPLAQELKRGTYRAVNGKYGELGSATTEAQKALARGLKDELVNAMPEVAGLNAEQQALITAKKVASRRALMDANNNPLGLTSLAPSKSQMMAFLLDRNVAAKALAARGLHQAAQGAPSIAGLLENLSPLQRAALITSLADQ